MKPRPVMDQAVFSTQTGRAAGFTPKQLRGPGTTRLFRGIYTTGSPDLAVRAQAALLASGPLACLCDCTSLNLAGVELPRRFASPTEPLHIHTPPELCGPQRAGIRCHRTATYMPADNVLGLPSLHLAECWLQLAARATVLELVIVGDGLMRRPRPPHNQPFLVPPDVLKAAVAESHRRPGIRAARAAAALVRPGTDSPMESVTRFHLVRAGLPEPRINYPVLDDTGWPIFFLDMAYPDKLIAVEYDGGIHVGDTRFMEKNIHRRRRLEDAGWRIITASARDLPNDMADVIASVRQALAARTASVPAH